MLQLALQMVVANKAIFEIDILLKRQAINPFEQSKGSLKSP